MKKALFFGLGFVAGSLLAHFGGTRRRKWRKKAAPPANFTSSTMEVNGVRIRYVAGGKKDGEALVLIHGFGQNWYMWNRLLPELSKHFFVIAPQLRGLGSSEKAARGYDKKTMAADIHELVQDLGFTKANVVGHDIGFMVAYAYAAQFPAETTKLVLMDAILPGIEPAYSAYAQNAWWWKFFSWPATADLLAGNEEAFFSNFWPLMEYTKNSFTPEEKAEFLRAYEMEGSIRASLQWFAAFDMDEIYFRELAKTKLTMPVLAMAGEHHTASFLEDHIKQVATNVKAVTITDAHHWLVQEQPEQVKKALLDFLAA